mmetsp:Transcript_2483/g.3696  ORF Transcript_2483/g.3696 Transcript_2483/m.3696 type:complete len:401 (+) Transcript_2483:85-1287(+)
MRLFLFFSTMVLFASAVTHSIDDSSTLVSELVNWVQSEEGFVNDKIQIRRVDPADPNSYFGVFANADIDAHEVLMEIPQSCYIEIFDVAKDEYVVQDSAEDSMAAYHSNICNLSHRLMEEMELGNGSEYAPYIAYLKAQKPGQLPVSWSQSGKDLLRQVLRPGHDGVDWIDMYFLQNNSTNQKDACITNDPFEINMLELTVQRSYDAALIPIWDMLNHHNGHYNAEQITSIYDEVGTIVHASKAIFSGEEILASYDKCFDCGDDAMEQGTPEILKNFGFVEGYPHRWVFNGDDGKFDGLEDLWFEVHSDGTDERWIEWWFNETTGVYDGIQNNAQMLYLQRELQRLDEVGRKFNLTSCSYEGYVPFKEWQMISEYYHAAKDAMMLVIGYAMAKIYSHSQI